MPQIPIKKVYGLELQSNSFDVREGSLEVASNVVVSQDNIIKKRRGFKEFYDPSTVQLRSLTEYKSQLISIASDRIQILTRDANDDFSSATTFDGSTNGVSMSIASGKKGRNVAANANLYFRADNATFKLESLTNDILKAGIEPAVDMQVFLQETSATETFFRPDSAVGYRAVFGRIDANNNKTLGSPSQFVTTTNASATSAYTLPGGAVVRVATSTPPAVNDRVYISNAAGSGIPDGVYTVTAAVAATSFDFNANTPVGTGNLSWGNYKTIRLDIGIPAAINSTQFFMQIYRTSDTPAASITPDESTLQLIDEFNLTAANISAGFLVYQDITPDILRGSYLYTNPNTGEARGIAEANERPPVCEDIAVFKNAVFYSNTQQSYSLPLSLISSNTTTFPTTSEFKTTQSAVARNYIGVTTAGNRTLRATTATFVLAVVTVTYNSHGFSTGDTISVVEALDSSDAQLTTLPAGTYSITVTGANTFTFTAPATPTGLAKLTFAGLTSGSKRVFYIDNTSTTASAIDTTARSIARALNRDTSGYINAYYVSGPTDIPGKMVLRSRSMTTTFTLNAVSAAIVDSFIPALPTTGSTVISTREDEQGSMYASKIGQPEAVPLENKIPVGSRSAAILRVAPLRDSLIIIKEDGVFRLNGNDISNYVVTILDNTVICKASDSVATLNNTVFLLSQQGTVSVSETAASIVSRSIEPVLTAVIGKSYIAAQSHAFGYESERLYGLCTVSPQATTSDTVYIYNNLTSGWSNWDSLFIDAIVLSSGDKLYYITTNNKINQERKKQNRLDYTGLEFSTTVLTTPSSTTATLSVVGGVPAIGDIFVKTGTNIINRITSISGSTLTFARAFSFSPSDTGLLYKGISSEVRTAPMTAGDSSKWKQFSEFQCQFRNTISASSINVSFLNDSIPGSASVDWSTASVSGGWGDLPWGNFPWGLEDGINAVYSTNSAQILRTYIPMEVSRGTFIQARLLHNTAAENIMIQEMAYTAREYGQRVTR